MSHVNRGSHPSTANYLGHRCSSSSNFFHSSGIQKGGHLKASSLLKSSPRGSCIARSMSTSRDSPSDDNFLLDNLGKMFGAAVLSVILLLVRSSRASTNRERVRDDIEDSQCLDPLEIEELRGANGAFKPEVFQKCVQCVFASFEKEATYPEFISTVIKAMSEEIGAANTVKKAHYLDRAIFSYPGYRDDKKFPLSLLLVALSMALYSTVDQRLKILFDVLLMQECVGEGAGSGGNVTAGDALVKEESVGNLVQHLLDTCQLPADNQVFELGSKYPIQNYQRGEGIQLVRKARQEATPEDKFGQIGDDVSYDVFVKLLKSRAGPCPWGECYVGLRRF